MSTIPSPHGRWAMAKFRKGKRFVTHSAKQRVTHNGVTRKSPKSCTQVESCVAHSVHHNSGGLKPKGKKSKVSRTYGVRFKLDELDKVRENARKAGCDTNSYIREAALKSAYKPPRDPELVALLRLTLRELSHEGNNLNQIARKLNGGMAVRDGLAMLESIRAPLIRALTAVRNALDTPRP